MPVDLDRARYVAGVIEEHVLVRLDDDDVGVVEMLAKPVGGDQFLGVGVILELRGVVERCGHDSSSWAERGQAADRWWTGPASDYIGAV